MATAFGPPKWVWAITRARDQFLFLMDWRVFRSVGVFFARFVPFFPIFVAGAAGVLLPFNQ